MTSVSVVSNPQVFIPVLACCKLMNNSIKVIHLSMLHDLYLESCSNANFSLKIDVCNFQLDDLRDLVRGNLNKIGRMTLSALITIEVHARDVVHKMVEEKVESPNAFEWISQLRLVLN